MESELKKQLQAAGVYIRDGALESILETSRSMREQGKENFLVRRTQKIALRWVASHIKQVIADFDMTLTHYYINGGRGKTSFGELAGPRESVW